MSKNQKRGMTRRTFLGSVGAATLGVAVTARSSGTSNLEEPKAEHLSPLKIEVNSRTYNVLVEPRWSLLYVLREVLDLTGTKPGCERGECGACTVLIDDKPRYACLTLALEAEGHRITTIEGLLKGEELGPVQQSFAKEDAFQCGYCTSGQIMAAQGLLTENANPNPEEIRLGMSGNLCRCGAYTHIFRAVQRAAKLRKAVGGAS